MVLVIPGDTVGPQGTQLGPGVCDSGLEVRSAIAGHRQEHNGVSYIEANSKRYVPSAKDFVVGVVTQRLADMYRVTLQENSKPVRLDQMAFESASKKNKPNLQVGDVVYGRVSRVCMHTDPEIECFDATTGKAGGFGHLKGGTLISVGLAYARQLLFRGHPILDAIGKKYPFEIAVGVNGKVWVKGPDNKTTLQIAQLITKAEKLSQEEALRLVG